jgi:transposase
MSIPGRMAMSEPVRRLELFTGAGRRRTWSEAEKATIVAESEAPHTSISAVARRHRLSASQLFTWRRLARQAVTAELRFVPAVLAPDLREPVQVDPSVPSPRCAAFAGIEIAVAGATVRVGPEASEAQIAAVIRALQAST